MKNFSQINRAIVAKKKFFLFAAALIAAMTVNAVVYDLAEMNFAESDLTVTNGKISKNVEKYNVQEGMGRRLPVKLRGRIQNHAVKAGL